MKLALPFRRTASTEERGAPTVPLYLDALAKQVDRADVVPTTAMDVPPLLFQLARMTTLPAERRLQFATHLANGAVDDTTSEESAVSFAMALWQLNTELSALASISPAMLHRLRWRAFELCIRAGLAFEARALSHAAQESGPMPDEALREMSRWARNANCLDVLSETLEQQVAQSGPQATEQRLAALESATRSVAALVEEGGTYAR